MKTEERESAEPRGDAGATVGIVIRTLNEEALLGECLETLRRQRGQFDLDILVVDSGSTDATIAIARAHAVRVIELPPGEFDYSRALNVGIEEVRGELVVSLSAHAVPVDDDWLAHMMSPFDDPRVAGVASRQIPWPGASWAEVHRLSNQFGELPLLSSSGGGGDIVFSNAASAIRRSVWLAHPFTLPAAEDLDWARRVIAAGFAVVYEPRAAVYHSHDESPRAQALRMIDINRVLDAEGGRRTRLRTLREAAVLLRQDSPTILRLDESPRRKLVYLADLLRMVTYYVIDFTRAGTTAERRSEELRRAANVAGSADARHRTPPA
jgi:GT2 family glycosyltransferase